MLLAIALLILGIAGYLFLAAAKNQPPENQTLPDGSKRIPLREESAGSKTDLAVVVITVLGILYILISCYNITLFYNDLSFGKTDVKSVFFRVPVIILGFWAGIGLITFNNTGRQFGILVSSLNIGANIALNFSIIGIALNALFIFLLLQPRIARKFKS